MGNRQRMFKPLLWIVFLCLVAFSDAEPKKSKTWTQAKAPISRFWTSEHFWQPMARFRKTKPFLEVSKPFREVSTYGRIGNFLTNSTLEASFTYLCSKGT